MRHFYTHVVFNALAVGALLVGTLGSALTAAETASHPSIGQAVENFSLQDFRGKVHALDDYTDSECVVIAFLGVECPLARLYAPRLQQLADEYADQGVTFIGIDPNSQDSLTELASYARRHGVEFPLLKDTGNLIADSLGVERVPEVYVLDANRVVRYCGRVDDQYGLGSSTGYAKLEVRRRHLAVAIDEVLAGSDVQVPHTEPHGCLIGRARVADESSEVTYSNQIARILQNHCVECHRPGQIAPFALTEYDEVVGWADMIAEVIDQGRMPPWHADPRYGHFINDRSMSAAEKEMIFAWVKHGAPLGDPSQLPEPIEYPEGLQGGEPDAVYYMSGEPYTVQAEGVLDYQYFTVDPGWEEDKWMCVSECVIDNRAVVHHIFVFAVPPGIEIPEFGGPEEAQGEFNPGSGGVELIAGAAPGTPPWRFHDGMATHLKAGTRLVFQMHYTANGTEQLDRSGVAFQFCDPADVRRDVSMDMAINFAFRIPAGAHNHPVEAVHKFQKDTVLLTFAPHMHLRGKSFRYELHYPDGTSETLLDVPQYDFNWQMIYMLAEPKLAPAGSELYCLAHFDNSEDNPANPDPTSEVLWGDQTWEEMMIGWFSASSDVEAGDFGGTVESRTARFERSLKSGPPRISGLLKKAARGAHESQMIVDRFASRLTKIVPQIDRVCISRVDGETLRFVQVSQSPVLDYAMGRTEREYPASESGLAGHALAGETVVHDDLARSADADVVAMRRAARSSLHVPIVLDGQPALVSFWSKEPAAFVPSAVELIEPLARSVGTEK